jgi:nicotinamide riboside kinase
MHKIKIVVTGPESSGKSTVTKQISEVLGCSFCPEFARFYLQDLGRNYTFVEVATMANGQIAWEDWYGQNTAHDLICDTDLSVFYVWYLYKYKIDNQVIFNQLKTRLADVYLLTKPDFEWQTDVLREHENERWELFNLYLKLLIDLEAKFVILEGNEESRVAVALDFLEKKTSQFIAYD